MDAATTLDLLDWKRRVGALYAEVRAADDPATAWRRWRETRDELFRAHPQSPRPGHAALRYWDYDPSARVLAELEDAEAEAAPLETSGAGAIRFRRVARARFELHGEPLVLDVHWLDAYGGGLFLPFRDATSGRESYGGGRYLLDTVKGADLGADGARLVLDFNFSYHPSCAYDPRWVCPLAPPGNRLAVAVEAGERLA
ncbi:MAG TPA: DUF1684 domain-containing protein [Gaiellaceae bacterium]|nr:DUF1684 domain-containing protein [Gaiellaceae bacterium]